MTAIDPMTQSELERSFDTQFRILGQDLPDPEVQYRFAPPRQWKFDRAWPMYKVAVELEGIFRGGHTIRCHKCKTEVRARKGDGSPGKVMRLYGWHQRYSRFKSDKVKYNKAVRDGWFILRFIYDDVHGDPFDMVDMIRSVLESRKHTVRAIESLSNREDEVIHMLAAGMTSPEIASRLSLSIATIYCHSQNIRQKLVARNRAEAISRAFAWGLLDMSRIPWQDVNPEIFKFDDNDL